MAAISYEDYMQFGTWADGFGGSVLDLNGLDFATTEQLGFPWVSQGSVTPRIVVREFDYVSTPVDIVALLDVNFSDSLQVAVSHGPGTLLFPLNPIVEYASNDFVRNMYFVLPSRVLTNALVFEFRAPSSGWFSIGRIWAGPLWQLPGSVNRTWGSRVVDLGERSRSPRGQVYVRRVERIRQTRLSLKRLKVQDVIGVEDNTVEDLQQIGYRVGTTSPVLLFPRTHNSAGVLDLHAMHRLGFYGSLTRDLDLQHDDGPLFQAEIEAEEWL